MQRLLTAGLLALTFASATAAQDVTPAPKPQYTPEAMLRRIQRDAASGQEPQQQNFDATAIEQSRRFRFTPAVREQLETERLPVDVRNAIRDQRTASTCAVPQSTWRVTLNAVATFNGQSYRCVEVFVPSPDGTIERQGLGWIRADAPISGSSAK